MLVLNVCEKVCPEKLNFDISHRVGDGADGEVFELKNGQILKLCIHYDWGDTFSFENLSKVLDYLKNNQVSHFAQVYDFSYLGEYERNLYGDKKQKYFLYYYTMERLEKISEDEKKVFHSILSHEDRNIEKNFSILKIKEMLRGMSMGLDFDIKNVILFCEQINKSSIYHKDIHPRNILKDKQGRFKLIDFDRCELKN